MRRLFQNFIFLFVLLAILSSCGQEKLNKSKTTTSTTNLSGTQCSFTTSGPPVCGQDGKDYLNTKHAECFTTVAFEGHCDCTGHVVCGSDGKNYNECDAKASSITITKYVRCDSPEL